MKFLFTFLIALLVCLSASAQTNLPPLPPEPTSGICRFATPANQRQFFTMEFEYTNIVYPIFATTNLIGQTNWQFVCYATNATVTVTFPIDQSLTMKYYRAGRVIYFGPPWNPYNPTNP